MVKAEWKYLKDHKLMVGVLLVLMLVPLLYTTIFLSSMWDPYGKTDNLPVAVINKDEGATYAGQKIDIGDKLVNNLKKKDSFDFKFKKNEKQAKKDLKEGKYYMVLVIPENFSKRSTTIFTDKPKKMDLDYYTNYGSSYVAGKMTSSGAEKIANSLDKTVTKSYTTAMLSSIKQLQGGLTQAANGNKQIAQAAGAAGAVGAQMAQANTKLAKNLEQASQQLGSVKLNEKNIDTLVSPVQLHSHDDSDVPNNGTGMTPYMMSVALFVGCLALNLMYDVAAPRKKPKTGISWWAAKMSVIGTFAILQAIVAYAGMVWFLGLDPIHPWATLGVVVMASLAFSNLVTLLNAAFGKVGAFLSLLLLIVQLGGSGGTYPIQLSNSFFEGIHDLLPLSYSVHGLRESLMIGQSTSSDLWVLFGVALVSALLMIWVFRIRANHEIYAEPEI